MGISSALGSSALLPAGLGFRNIVINGGFDVWQRGTSASMGTTQSSSFQADRWSAYRNGGGATQSRRDAGLDGFQYCYRMQRDSGNALTAKLYVGTSFETSTVMKLQNKFVVLSFYARKGTNFSATSDIFTARLYTGTGTECNGIYVGLTNLNAVIDQNATLSTTWQRFTYSGLMPSTVTQCFIEFSYTPTGTASTNDYVEITGVQLEQNYQPTPFEQRPIGVELALCQRYYYRHVDASLTSVGTICAAANFSATDARGQIYFPVTMRGIPTLVASSGTNYYAFARNAADDSFNSLTITSATPTCATVYNASEISGTAGHGGYFRTDNSSASVAFNAEL